MHIVSRRERRNTFDTVSGFVESASGLHSDKRTKESLVIKQPRKSSSAS